MNHTCIHQSCWLNNKLESVTSHLGWEGPACAPASLEAYHQPAQHRHTHTLTDAFSWRVSGKAGQKQNDNKAEKCHLKSELALFGEPAIKLKKLGGSERRQSGEDTGKERTKVSGLLRALGERHPRVSDACSSIRTTRMEGEHYGLSSSSLLQTLFGIRA